MPAQRRPFSGASSAGHHVAVVGSGPGGFYTSKYLLKAGEAHGLKVHMFERLPTPYGLVRFGVAPDHPEVKNVINDFAAVGGLPAFRFFGNVEIGLDATLAELRRAYDAVVVCTGAEGERLLGIPGEGLRGVVGAPAFVKWYNSHPDYTALDPPDPGEAAVVIGQGNVALDIARVLARAPSELSATDINTSAASRIARWQRDGLRTIQVVGRRGHVQAAFTNKELRELLSLEGVLPVVDPAEYELCCNEASLKELARNRPKKRSVKILERMLANFAEKDTTSKRVIWLRFLLSPTEVLADAGEVVGLRVARNELRGEPGKQAAVRASPESSLDLPCGLVLRSVGFARSPLDGLPMSPQGRVSHGRGLVAPGDGPASGLYASGWMKRGPTGVIATNIPDARETAANVLSGLGAPEEARSVARGALLERLAANKRIVSFADWRAIEAEELRRGAEQGRIAERLTDFREMLSFADEVRLMAG